MTVTLDFDRTLTSTYGLQGWLDGDCPARQHPHRSGHRPEYYCVLGGDHGCESDFSTGFCVAGRTLRPSWRTPWTGWA